MEQAGATAVPAPSAPRPWSPLDLACRLQVPLDGVPEGIVLEPANAQHGARLWIAGRAASTEGAGLLWRLDGDLTLAEPAPTAAWPLGPVLLPGPDGPRVACAGRAADELWIVDAGDPAAAPQRLPLGGRPRALGAGPLEDERPALVVATREGELLWWDGERLHRSDLPPGSPTFVRVLPRTVVVGMQGPDRVLRAFLDGERELALAAPEPVDGIPRDWCTTPRAEWLAGGDRSLWTHGAAGWTAAGDVGLVPLRLAHLGGERLLCLTLLDLSLREVGPTGFGPATYAGQDPWDLVSGDLDGDGVRDVLVVHRAARCVSLLRGSDRGGWRDAPSLPAGRAPHSLAAGDLDGDGLVDALALAAIDDRVRVFRGTPDGGYTAAGDVAVGTAADRARLADLDGDGHLDLVVVVEGGAGARLERHPGRGDGRFGPPEHVDLGRGRGDLCVLRDGAAGSDARDGLLAADPGEACLWHLAPGSSTARRIVLDATPTALAPFSAHGGATRGVLVALDGARRGVAFHVLRDGELVEAGFCALDGPPVDLEPADLDGDGEPEVLVLLRTVRDNDPGTLVVLDAGAGPGGSWGVRARHTTGLRPMALAVGDLDGDGRDDALVAAQNSHCANLWVARDGALVRQPDLGLGRGPLDALLLPGEALVACGFSDEVRVVRSR